jgi:chromatin remodeling complex protein RSC6
MTTASKLSSSTTTTTVTASKGATTTPVATKGASTKASAKAASVATPAAVETPAAPAVKKAASKKAAATPAPVETPAAVTTATTPASGDATEATTPAAVDDSFGPRFTALLERLQSLTNDVREVTTSIRVLQKEHTRFVRENSKKNSKRQNRVKRTASGFAKPTLLSEEMYNFLGIDKNSLVVRNDVTRKLNEYVLTNNLRDAKDKAEFDAFMDDRANRARSGNGNGDAGGDHPAAA